MTKTKCRSEILEGICHEIDEADEVVGQLLRTCKSREDKAMLMILAEHIANALDLLDEIEA